MTATTPASERARLAREREFLLRSIEDLELEHAAGDVDDTDYQALRADYVGRAAEVLRALSSPEPEAVPPRDEDEPRFSALRRRLGRAKTRRLLVSIGIVCVLGVIAIAAAGLAGVRFPGESTTGTVALPRATQIRNDLSAAALLADSGSQAEAVELYQSVLALDPSQPEALAYRGWLVRLAGKAERSAIVVANGDRSIAQAVAVAPGFADARAFDAIALYEDRHAPRRAVAEVSGFAADRPSSAVLSSYGHTLAGIDEKAGAPVPAILRPYDKVTDASS